MKHLGSFGWVYVALLRDDGERVLEGSKHPLLLYRRSMLAVPLLFGPLCALFLGTFPHSLNRLAGR